MNEADAITQIQADIVDQLRRCPMSEEQLQTNLMVSRQQRFKTALVALRRRGVITGQSIQYSLVDRAKKGRA